MSFALTEGQLLDGIKSVTRRLGWRDLSAGQRLLAVRKAMGLQKGERQVVLGTVDVIDVRREPLYCVTVRDCTREGFGHLSPAEFVRMFRLAMRCRADEIVTRIVFQFHPSRERGDDGRRIMLDMA